MSLYKQFDVTSKDELYQLVKDDNLQVKDLTDFIRYTAITDLTPSAPILKNSADIAHVLKAMKPLNEDEAVAFFVDAKNRPVHLSRFTADYSKEIIASIKEGIIANADGVILAVSDEINEWDIHRVEAMHSQAQFKVKDCIIVRDNGNELFSEKHKLSYQTVNSFSYELETDQFKNWPQEINNDLIQMPETLEFLRFYVKQEVTGLNITHDFETIQKALKVAYQYENREVAGAIFIDDNCNILDVETIFHGGLNETIIDGKIIARKTFEKDAVGSIIFHNHPSSNPEPSEPDIELTKHMGAMHNLLELNLFDHYIIGKQGVYSLVAGEDYQIRTTKNNELYQRNIRHYRGKNKISSIDMFNSI